MKLTMVVERGSYPKFLNALPAGSKAVEQGTDPPDWQSGSGSRNFVEEFPVGIGPRSPRGKTVDLIRPVPRYFV